VAGTWKDLTDLGQLDGRPNLTGQVRNNRRRGDRHPPAATLSRKITVDVKGEILELKNTINTMVDQLNAFASEVTRVAARVGHGRAPGRTGRRLGRRRAPGRTHRQRQLRWRRT
jgi:HAMP domain-containing protein